VASAKTSLALVLGANSGIGAACVELFAARGWSVIAGFHEHRDRLDALVRRSTHNWITVLPVDVTNTHALASLHDYCHQRAMALDAVVVTASYNDPRLWNLAPFDARVDDLVECFRVEIGGLHNTLRTLHPLISAGGAVVAFSSASALHGDDDTFVYNVSKVGVTAYVRMIAKHYGSSLRVNCIAPDSISTDWLSDWHITPQELADFRVNRAGAKRIGTPAEAAALVFFLCTADSSFISGQTITLDGGAG